MFSYLNFRPYLIFKVVKMRKIRKAVITAAGFGSRFLPVVKATPKEMLPVIDKPILQYVVEECQQAGLEEIIIVVRQGNNVIRDYFGKLEVHEHRHRRPLPTAPSGATVPVGESIKNITIID